MIRSCQFWDFAAMVRSRVWALFLVVFVVSGCKPPPPAPEALEDLCAYLFEHMADEDDEALEEGLVNLENWLVDGLEKTQDGYNIENLSLDAIESTGETGDNTALVGASVASVSKHELDRQIQALVIDDQAAIFGDNYVVFDRSYETDESCFPGRDCLHLEGTSYTESSWAGLLDVVSESTVEFRWVETPSGWMMIQRSYLNHPAEINWESVEVNAQYFLAVVLPCKGSSVRLQAMWIDAEYGVLPVGEDFALNQLVQSLQDASGMLETWMDEN